MQASGTLDWFGPQSQSGRRCEKEQSLTPGGTEHQSRQPTINHYPKMSHREPSSAESTLRRHADGVRDCPKAHCSMLEHKRTIGFNAATYRQ